MNKIAEDLTEDEAMLAEALVRIADKYGKFNEDGNGIWAGYESAEENDDKEIGVYCMHCVLYQGDSVCKIIEGVVEDLGKCRFAVIPDDLVNISEDEMEDEMEDEGDEEGEYPEGEPAGDEDSEEEIPHKSSEVGKAGAAKFTLDEFLSMMQEAGYDMSEVAPAAEYVDMPSVPPMEENDLNLEEILAMLEAEDASIQEEQASEEMASEVTKLQEEIAEYRTAVEFLRGKLNEVNLLNAKLLYTNKIFRKEGLTNEQKVTIVENFDRATTVREVKMVYAVLAETLTADTKSKAVKLPRKVVTEGLASKATPSTAPKTETPEIISENSVTKRLQQLAGII